jgi:hypothetical protein
MDEAEITIADVASRKKIVLSHPGSVELGGDLYSGAERSEIDLAERQTYRGRSRFNSNSLLIDGGSSTFVISPGTVVSGTYLNATIFAPTGVRISAYWLLKMIKTLKVQIPGQSGFGDLSISGQAHFMAVMAMTASGEKRQALAEACPRYHNQVGGGVIAASVPIVLPWSASEVTAKYGLDTRVFSTPLNITVEWESSWKVMSGFTGNDLTGQLPTSFTSLYMRTVETDILDSRVNLGNKLKANPSLAYPIPFLTLQSAVEPIANVVPGVEFQTTLNALPSGMIQCILLSMIPDVWTGSSAGSAKGESFVHPFGVDFQSLRIEKDGQVIYQFDTRVEGDLSQTMAENAGNGKSFHIVDSQSLAPETPFGVSPSVGVDPYDSKTVPVNWRHRVYVIPICHEISEVLTERRMEHVPNYAGINLQIFGNIAGSQFQDTNSADLSRKSQAQDPLASSQDAVQLRNPGLTPANPIVYPPGVAGTDPAQAAPANYRLHVCYVRAAIMETIGQTVKLIT